MTRKETVDFIRKRTAQIRAILRLVETDEFDIAFEKASVERRAQVLKIETTKAMREWLAFRCPLSELSYRKLRDLAFKNHVHNYSRLDKEDLIEALTAKGISNEGLMDKNRETTGGTTAGVEDMQNPGASIEDAGGTAERHCG